LAGFSAPGAGPAIAKTNATASAQILRLIIVAASTRISADDYLTPAPALDIMLGRAIRPLPIRVYNRLSA